MQDFRSKTVIKEAIMENDFLKNLSSSQVVETDSESVWSDFNSSFFQVQELVEAMHEKRVPKGCYVIREGQVQIIMIIVIVANQKSIPFLVSNRGLFV